MGWVGLSLFKEQGDHHSKAGKVHLETPRRCCRRRSRGHALSDLLSDIGDSPADVADCCTHFLVTNAGQSEPFPISQAGIAPSDSAIDRVRRYTAPRDPAWRLHPAPFGVSYSPRAHIRTAR